MIYIHKSFKIDKGGQYYDTVSVTAYLKWIMILTKIDVTNKV